MIDSKRSVRLGHLPNDFRPEVVGPRFYAFQSTSDFVHGPDQFPLHALTIPTGVNARFDGIDRILDELAKADHVPRREAFRRRVLQSANETHQVRESPREMAVNLFCAQLSHSLFNLADQ